MIKVGQEDLTGKGDSKKVLLKLLLTRAKNDNFKTRDFSPLIERVLAGVA